MQSKLTQGESVLNDTARDQLRRDFDRARVDYQRFTQEAEEEMQQLQQQLQNAFAAKLFPVLGQVVTEKDLWAVLSQDEAGILWKNPALDVSDEIAKRMGHATTATEPLKAHHHAGALPCSLDSSAG